MDYISIHAPARGATKIAGNGFTPNIPFQSTLPRGERLVTLGTTFEIYYFNPRSREGSDAKGIVDFVLCDISIHAPARGATLLDRGIPSEFHNFNPRSREGSDAFSLPTDSILYISIHAPARGATICSWIFFIAPPFQSTLPRGERHIRQLLVLYGTYFNPRSREGSDFIR